MTACCQCGRKYWPGKKECPGDATSEGCGHKPCNNCTQLEPDKWEKTYDEWKQSQRTQK